MSRELGWYLHPLRVRYQETDQMGVVFHGNYVNWFEIGRTEWIRNAGYAYKRIEEHGMLLPVIDLTCRFIMPAKYDDTLLVCTRIAEMTPLRIAFESEIRRVALEDFHGHAAKYGEALPGELLVQGGTKHVWVNRSFQPTRLSKAFPELYDAISRK
ncbi:thioesterase family protein [Paenibacillus sp. HB172176]|uniref:acyl-CoA thioesterase n=1 Tax=Paenibacillus sp. HB172176 TaxID=2493690 RepID=UPI00143B88AB|nr:thioesterase family protein [Paenibacillus sp. HB172176]